MMKFLVGSCEQRPMLRDGTVLRSSADTAVTTGTKRNHYKVTHLTGLKLDPIVPLTVH